MRIDLALKYLCIVKSRSKVKQLCDAHAVRINEKPAKASAALHVGDRIAVDFAARTLRFELIDIPDKQLSKTAAVTYYRVIDNG